MDELQNVGLLGAVTGVGGFTLAAMRLVYGTYRDRIADFRERLEHVEAERDYWRARYIEKQELGNPDE